MKARLTRLLPILAWLPRYDRRWLRGDDFCPQAVAAGVGEQNVAVCNRDDFEL